MTDLRSITIGDLFDQQASATPNRLYFAHHTRNQEYSYAEFKQLVDAAAKGFLAIGISNRNRDREIMKEAVEDTGRHVVHELGRYLNSLGTIAAITPLLGLLGTVIGMVKVFTAITTHGVGDPGVLAGGISEALITTGVGLSIAIPSLIGYRYLRGRVDGLVVQMEKEVMKLVDAIHQETPPKVQQS